MDKKSGLIYRFTEKLQRMVALALCVLLALTQFPASVLAEGGRAAAFNIELMDDMSNWAVADGVKNADGSIALNAGGEGSGLYTIDLAPLQTAVDAGGLHATISSSISYPGDGPTTTERAAVTFMAGETSLSNGDAIPAGSTSVVVTVTNPTDAAALFTLSFAFNDTAAPTFAVQASTSAWTNGDVTVTTTAADTDSGVWSVFESDSEGNASTSASLTDNENGTYTASANGTYYFTAEDFAGNSVTTSCTVSNIDKTNPSAPSISLSDENEWATAAVTVTVTGDSAPEGQSPQSVEYTTNDGAFSAYTGAFTVTEEGLTKISARVRDN